MQHRAAITINLTLPNPFGGGLLHTTYSYCLSNYSYYGYYYRYYHKAKAITKTK